MKLLIIRVAAMDSSISPDEKIGGIYLWESQEAADAFYDDAWHARIVDTYGEPGRIEYFDAPLVLANREL